MMTFVCYPKCSTCQKAQKWLDSKHLPYDVLDIKLQNPSYEELRDWHSRSGLPLRRFFNTSGLVYRSMELKEKLDSMTEEQQLRLLATDGMLVKRPILVSGGQVLLGFKEAQWEAALGGN